jgi:hypothetical protein
MITHDQAKELHELLAGGPIPEADLERARELAAIVLADTEPHPADNVSYAPCITGKIEIGDTTTEFMLPLLNDSVTYTQWGAPTYVLGPRVDLLEKMSDGAREWAEENLCRTCKENLLDDGEGYDGECGDCADKTEGKRSSTCTVCHEAITRDEDDEWVHSDGDKYCGTGDGAMALPEDDDDDD